MKLPPIQKLPEDMLKNNLKTVKKNQLEFLKEYILKSDAVITTAAIPGRKAPILIEKSTV